jgi:hypothetical protein
VEVSLQQIARALNGEIRGAQVLAPGPGHSTADRSLSVTINASGDDIVVHSFAGDDPIQCKKYVRERCGIQFKPNGNGRADVDLAKLMQEAIASQRREPKGKLIDVFTYRDADGTKLYDVLKYDEPRRYAHRLPDGTFQGSARRVVYRWPELLKFPSTTTYVTEGEKDSNRLWDLGMVATTVASGKWTDTCVEALRGRELLILEDNDEAGRNKALQAARLLYPVANYVKIVRLPA